MALAPKKNRRPMDTAPRDGTTIIVGDEDCGEFPMRWDSEMTNGLFPGVKGFWVVSGNLARWDESKGLGPTYWLPASH